MTVSINGNQIPLPMRERGWPVMNRFPTRVDNGLGATQTAGLPSLTWRFNKITLADWQWWTVTILNGQPSVTVPAVLWNDQRVETSYSSVVVRYPNPPDKFSNGYYHNVVIEIDTMVEA